MDADNFCTEVNRRNGLKLRFRFLQARNAVNHSVWQARILTGMPAFVRRHRKFGNRATTSLIPPLTVSCDIAEFSGGFIPSLRFAPCSQQN